jgi:cytochrome oxidase Cu insertion factor (SCO1/SenC/PrrC family)
MGGTGGGLNANDPAIVSAFHGALYHQGLVALLIVGILALGWNVLRGPTARRSARAESDRGRDPGARAPEPTARRLLRIGFGVLWILDGLLQAQAAMPLGMVPHVIQPAAASSPTWVQHLINPMVTTWTYHPIVAATAAVWIQLGIGAWLLVAPRGNGSRLAGTASVGWGLVVWIFGEAFGGIFAPGLTWQSGAPGAVLVYCFAGLLIALPERRWQSARLGRVILATTGLLFLGMALLQAWPGRGFWQGRVSHSPGSLASIVEGMSQTSQPHWLSTWVTSFGAFDTAHGWAVNLFVVIALALCGVVFLVARPPAVLRATVVAMAFLCLVDWVLIEDLGFLGGTGTDPNSMIPMVLVFVAGYLALSPRLSIADAGSTLPVAPGGSPPDADAAPAWRLGLGAAAGASTIARSVQQALGRWGERLVADPTYGFRSLAALGAIGVTLIGVAPMAAAATNPNADPILAESAYGRPELTNIPTPAFSLVDQDGRRVSIASLHGKTVALTFFDSTCTHAAGGCATVQELRLVDRVLGTMADRVELVAINTNSAYQTPDNLASFDRRAGLNKVSNWMYLTGPLSQLRDVLSGFAIHVSGPQGYKYMSMGLPHGQTAYVIDGSGATREVLTTGDRGSESKVMTSSVAVALANAIEQVAG